jgi:uncharacterized protein with PIN domain
MEKTVEQIKAEANQFISEVSNLEISMEASRRSKEQLERTINQLIKDNENNAEALDIATHAVEILRAVSDETVKSAYSFLAESINKSLKKMFMNTTRQIELKESTFRGQYPQLDIILHVGNGKTRSLKTDSGHGVAQIISLLSILSLIVLTESRRILVMDEIVSGVSVHNRKVISDILWTFTEIGFQFIVNEHGFVPKGARVYTLEMTADVSHIKNTYICKDGVFLQGSDQNYDYSESDNSTNKADDDEINYDGEGELIEEPEEVHEMDDLVASGAVLSI